MTGPSSVTVTVPARLHFGFLDLNGGLGRRFGSIGLAIGGLRTRVRISRAPEITTTGAEVARARRYAEIMHETLGLHDGYNVHVAEAVPGHAGLGSGTQ